LPPPPWRRHRSRLNVDQSIESNFCTDITTIDQPRLQQYDADGGYPPPNG
ncbi:MAG: hypothetical protein GY820_00700, partial [Gammaproteobacteria bacterium]|nr:hypothetical protein [Gammaproteobacteria bacterium]